MRSGNRGRPLQGDASRSRRLPWRLLEEGVNRFVLVVLLLGTASFWTLLTVFPGDPWPLLPWLGLTAACAILGSFPYRIVRPGNSYFMDFDEIVLVISLLYLGAAPTVCVLVIGYLISASVRGSSVRRMLFNAGARATAVSGALVLVSMLPAPAFEPWDYLVPAVIAAALYAVINQVLVSRVISLTSGGSFRQEFTHSLATEVARTWPVVVSYGLIVGVASRHEPVLLLLASVPVILLVAASRSTQLRRDEHQRMRGLYGAAQQMHEAKTDQEVFEVLRASVKATLGVDGTALREQPPYGEELGAWLPNRKEWVIVPFPYSPATRRQDEAFLQAIASLVDAGMERATLVGELERHSFRDPLTNAFNRRYFYQALGGMLTDGHLSPGCLALIDIDYFKVINDTHGHEAGDNTLKLLVTAVQEIFRSSDLLCRMGGDEFALVLPGSTSTEVAGRMEELRERLAAASGTGGEGDVRFRISVGIASYPRDGSEMPTLLRCADEALYRAKRRGRDRVEVYG